MTISRRFFILSLVGVCVLSAGIGTGTTLLVAERGPEGATGPQGPRGAVGPIGPPGDSSSVDEGDIDDLDFRVSGLEDYVSDYYSEDIDSAVSDVQSQVDDLCSELLYYDIYC